MTTVKILVYTDTDKIATPIDDKGLGATILKRLLETKTLAFADFTVDVINRYEGFLSPQPPATPQKLTKTLLAPFDELWMFGWFQARVEQDFDNIFGGRENELDSDEVDVLKEWMASGGVLISGDHSEYAPGGKETDPIETFLCLGRALGHKIPRAGQLRQWKGPFTSQPESSFNTLVSPEPGKDPEVDAIPQTVTIEPVGTLPHQIFLGTKHTITILPDHVHEGQLILPSDLSDWPPSTDPSAGKPEPTFVARGRDSRHRDSYPVLTVYDGDQAGVGRIIADSSWHHFLDKNLNGLAENGVDAPLDLLRQLFHNIAFYLAPLSKRRMMMREMLKFFVEHPDVYEERGNSPYLVGRVALRNLSAISTRCEIDELLRLALPANTTMSSEYYAWPPTRPEGVLPTRDLIVGAIINRFYRTASERLAPGNALSISSPTTDGKIIAAGLKDALGVHLESLTNILQGSPALSLKIFEVDDGSNSN